MFLGQRAAIVDATAPHVLEPDAPGADEIVVSLYHTIRAEALAPHREEVKALFRRNAQLRARAARYVASAGSLLLDSRRAEACSTNFEKVRRYVKRLCTRVLPRCPDDCSPSEELRLLSAITPKGMVFYKGTVQALANNWHPVQLPGVQAVRCTRFLDRENLARCRARLRFNERAANELLEQAVALMAQAKSCHDELETYYRAAVDFEAVNAEVQKCAEMLQL